MILRTHFVGKLREMDFHSPTMKMSHRGIRIDWRDSRRSFEGQDVFRRSASGVVLLAVGRLDTCSPHLE